MVLCRWLFKCCRNSTWSFFVVLFLTRFLRMAMFYYIAGTTKSGLGSSLDVGQCLFSARAISLKTNTASFKKQVWVYQRNRFKTESAKAAKVNWSSVQIGCSGCSGCSCPAWCCETHPHPMASVDHKQQAPRRFRHSATEHLRDRQMGR